MSNFLCMKDIFLSKKSPKYKEKTRIIKKYFIEKTQEKPRKGKEENFDYSQKIKLFKNSDKENYLPLKDQNITK